MPSAAAAVAPSTRILAKVNINNNNNKCNDRHLEDPGSSSNSWFASIYDNGLKRRYEELITRRLNHSASSARSIGGAAQNEYRSKSNFTNNTAAGSLYSMTGTSSSVRSDSIVVAHHDRSSNSGSAGSVTQRELRRLSRNNGQQHQQEQQLTNSSRRSAAGSASFSYRRFQPQSSFKQQRPTSLQNRRLMLLNKQQPHTNEAPLDDKVEQHESLHKAPPFQQRSVNNTRATNLFARKTRRSETGIDFSLLTWQHKEVILKSLFQRLSTVESAENRAKTTALKAIEYHTKAADVDASPATTDPNIHVNPRVQWHEQISAGNDAVEQTCAIMARKRHAATSCRSLVEAEIAADNEKHQNSAKCSSKQRTNSKSTRTSENDASTANKVTEMSSSRAADDQQLQQDRSIVLPAATINLNVNDTTEAAKTIDTLLQQLEGDDT